MFVVERVYTKNDIYKLLDVPKESQKGSWDTGYRSYNGEIYIFTNVGTAGRTGVNHGNYWLKDNLVWFGKSNSHMKQNLIKMMISNEVNVHIFFRNDSTKGFTYKGLGRAISFEGSKPVKIIWSFINPSNKPSQQIQPIEGIDEIHESFKEGTSKRIEVSIYKRSMEARQKCIDLKGCFCHVCGFDFEKTYGKIGENYIHVHHIKPIATINGEYEVNPIQDLVPICPNCHAIIHSQTPPIPIQILQNIINDRLIGNG
ncbi:MAG TPA: DUF3427 domain-containing protein [Bacteroidales bacterium]|nr:DUF3427 domain-containing protein [Bacteroidales bacterium]HOR81252.1 DUF3427 domain-containing protein [Bacteroidales bacterium]HPJ90519.1 DUF3427 domain-containing protein [Bacteroidales bacterium]